MPFYLLKSSRLIAYSTPQAVQPMGSTSQFVESVKAEKNILKIGIPIWVITEF